MGRPLSKSAAEDTNLETFRLVWLDANVNTSQENISAQAKLQSEFHEFNPFADGTKCEEFIRDPSMKDRIILISSGRLGSEIVPRIHRYRQLFSVYIYCQNRDAHEQWARKFVKVQGVFTALHKLIDKILDDRKIYQRYKVDELPMSIFNGEHFQNGQMPELTNHFIYSQVLIDCLLQMEITKPEKTSLYNLCKAEYKTNKDELKIIEEFEKDYSREKSIWWFARDSFLYKTLMKALRIQNLDLLFLFRYVIKDIQSQIKDNECDSKIVVYRSQLLSKKQLQQLKDSLDQFISIDSFLLAIRDRETGLFVLSAYEASHDTERVLFEINADGELFGMTPFSKTEGNSYNRDDEFLFSIGSIFQLENISRGEDNIWIVRMRLCTKQEPQLRPIFQEIKNSYGSTETSFGLVLQDMEQFDEAEKYYQRLKRLSSGNPKFISECDETITNIYIAKENHTRRIEAIDESLKDDRQKPKVVKHNRGFNYCLRAEAHRKKGNLPLASKFYENALNIFKELYDDNHQEVGRCYKNIASIHQENKDYEKALENYNEAKFILAYHLPSDHPDLSEIDRNMREIQENLQQ